MSGYSFSSYLISGVWLRRKPLIK